MVLIVSDGKDSASDIGWREVRKRAVAEEVMIYAIGMEVEYFDGVRNRRTSPDRSLRRLVGLVMTQLAPPTLVQLEPEFQGLVYEALQP